MTCKDCVHYDVCTPLCTGIDMCLLMQDESVELLCSTFQDKSRFVELPCKIGDTFYWINHINHSIETDEVISIHIYKGEWEISTKTLNSKCISGYSVRRFWEIMFPTKEEAEKALERMKENGNL